MEEMFNNLKKAGKNDVDGLIKWLKDCNIIGTSKEAEDKVRGLFGQQSKDQAKVEFAKFKEVLEKLAAEHKKNLQDMTKALTEKGPDILNQLKGAASKAASTAQSAAKDAVGAVSKLFAKKD